MIIYSFIYISLVELKISSDDHLKQRKWILKPLIRFQFRLIYSQPNKQILLYLIKIYKKINFYLYSSSNNILVSISTDQISHLQGRSSCSNPLNFVRSRAHTSQNKATVVVRVKLLQTFPTHSRTDCTTVSLKDVVQRYPKMPCRRCGNAGNEENQRESVHFW